VKTGGCVNNSFTGSLRLPLPGREWLQPHPAVARRLPRDRWKDIPNQPGFNL
jgi:hypothetical protein